MDLYKLLENIKSKEYFITFLKELENNYLNRVLEWENTSINVYIGSIWGWLEDVLVCYITLI